MMPSYGEWGEVAKKARDAKIIERMPQLQMLRQAALKAEMVTGLPEFDHYLTYLAAAVEDTEKQLETWEAILADPKIVDAESIMRAKIAMAECNARINAWNAALSLPKDIIEMGGQARDLLERMPE